MRKFLVAFFVLISVCRIEMWADGRVPQIIPAPQSYLQEKGEFHWDGQVKVFADWEVIPKEMMENAFAFSGAPAQFVDAFGEGDKVIALTIADRVEGTLSDEGYSLQIEPRKVSVSASSVAGVYYGIRTLLQLFEADGEKKIHAAVITDEPRFPYRGVMIDVSRHFRTIGFLEKQIDLLASFKINRLHLHLTDAAGWRLEIKKYPRLTEFAAWRPQESWKDWNKGGNTYCEESPEAYGGYYTQEEMRGLIAYAALRNVTIIPEIEMPSHSEEVLATYPELSCTHKTYGQSDFCIGNERTFSFLEDVLSEVIDLFPSEYIHIGGDEAGKAAWRTCPLCQKRMQEEGLKDVDELQSYLIHRIEKYLNSKGKHLLGWDEILQGGVAPNATVMSWRGEDGGIKAALSGHKAIMSPGEYCYIDSYQDAPYSQPEAIGGYLPLSKVYSYDPIPAALSGESAKLIYGVQANLWAEYITTDSHYEYMLYPRTLALSEVAWTNPENKSWDSFRSRVLDAIPRMQARGYTVFDYSKEIGNRPEAAKPVRHLAEGKPVKFNIPYWPNYPANGEKTLTDGLRGGWNYNDRRWLGFADNCRMDVVIDLEQEETIHYVGADFMQICGPDVYMPAKVIISVSDDGENFTELATIDHQVVKDDQVSFKTFSWEGKAKARFIRYQAIAATGHGGIQFVDEIIVR